VAKLRSSVETRSPTVAIFSAHGTQPPAVHASKNVKSTRDNARPGECRVPPCRAHLTAQMALQHIRHDCLAWNSAPPARVTCPRTRHAFRRPARITDQCTRTRTRRAAAGAGSPSIAGITVSDAADHGRRSERPCAAVGSIVRGAESVRLRPDAQIMARQKLCAQIVA